MRLQLGVNHQSGEVFQLLLVRSNFSRIRAAPIAFLEKATPNTVAKSPSHKESKSQANHTVGGSES
jgi:hypothetical protein